MHRMLIGAAIAAATVSSSSGAEPVLSPGSRIRLIALPAPEAGFPGRETGRPRDQVHMGLTSPDRDTVTEAGRGGWLVGTLVALDESFLVVRTAEHGDELRIARDSIATLEVSTGKRRQRGALQGAAIAGLAGALAGLAAGDDPPGFISFSAGEKATLLGAAGVPIGALLGALTARERWQAASPVQVALVPGTRGSAAELRVSW